MIVTRAVGVSRWLPGYAGCQWGNGERVDTQARSTVENKCLFEQGHCCVALNFSLKLLKNHIKSMEYVISATEGSAG
jgi:hypothetical protein